MSDVNDDGLSQQQAMYIAKIAKIMSVEERSEQSFA